MEGGDGGREWREEKTFWKPSRLMMNRPLTVYLDECVSSFIKFLCNSVAILAQMENTVAQALVSVCVMDVKSVPHEAISEICAYIGDLRSFACVARALVTDTHWHGRVEQLWPGAAALLFGTFAFQVRALLARASAIEEPLRWIDPSSPTAGVGLHGGHGTNTAQQSQLKFATVYLHTWITCQLRMQSGATPLTAPIQICETKTAPATKRKQIGTTATHRRRSAKKTSPSCRN